MIVGWRAATKMTTPLVLDALEMALWTPRKQGVTDLAGLVHHSPCCSVTCRRPCMGISYLATQGTQISG